MAFWNEPYMPYPRGGVAFHVHAACCFGTAGYDPTIYKDIHDYSLKNKVTR